MPRGKQLLVLAAGVLFAACGPTTAVPEPPETVAWSPETATLAFTTRIDGDSEIVLQRGLAGEPERLTDSPGLDLGPSWTPDGEQIFFQSLRDGNREIYVMNADGSEPRNVTDNPNQDLLVEVAPDGRRIAFFSDREVADHPANVLPGHLYVMELPDGEPRRVTAEPLTSTFNPAWHPDGGSLLYARDFDGNTDLVVLDLDGGPEHRLEGTPDPEYGGRYSPDGEQIVFHVNVGGGEEARLVLMNAEGTGRRNLTEGGQHYDPSWSPDGRWVLFTGAALGESQFDLLMVPAAAGGILPATAAEVMGSYGAWQPVTR